MPETHHENAFYSYYRILGLSVHGGARDQNIPNSARVFAETERERNLGTTSKSHQRPPPETATVVLRTRSHTETARCTCVAAADEAATQACILTRRRRLTVVH